MENKHYLCSTFFPQLEFQQNVTFCLTMSSWSLLTTKSHLSMQWNIGNVHPYNVVQIHIAITPYRVVSFAVSSTEAEEGRKKKIDSNFVTCRMKQVKCEWWGGGGFRYVWMLPFQRETRVGWWYLGQLLITAERWVL